MKRTMSTKLKDDQNFWNFWLLVLSVLLLVVEVWWLALIDKIPTSVGIFDAILITLATFRVTRLFVYDSIMHMVRDLFLIRTVIYTDTEVIVRRRKYPSGVMRAMSDLFSCPWCFGLQAAMLVVFFYYLTPWAWIIIFMFAVGGVATLLQLIANAIGWKAEHLKRKTEATLPDEHLRGSSGGTCG